jgi:hypothetical protein
VLLKAQNLMSWVGGGSPPLPLDLGGEVDPRRTIVETLRTLDETDAQ